MSVQVARICFFDGRGWSEDDEGLELACAEDAYLEAFAGARSMWSELIEARQDPNACAFHVKGEDGALLFRLGFSELIENCVDAPRRAPGTVITRLLEETYERAAAARAGIRSSFDEVRRSIEESRRLLAHIDAFGRQRARLGVPHREDRSASSRPDRPVRTRRADNRSPG